MRELENQSLGKYELIREIGYGSMGTVYLARDPFTHRDVAIKVEIVKSDLDARAARRRRKMFFNEAKAAGMLRHPNIVAVVDAGTEEDVRYLVMEYVPGTLTLDRYCAKENLLPVEHAVELILECAIALDYAHRKGVVHRDIKPKNIMLTQDREVKIGDFGIALITNREADETQVLGTIGSPRYMSPEQIMGEAATNQSDIFSLGIVLYELLTGQNPFMARTMPQIARTITHTAHAPLDSLRPEIPPALAHIVDRTLKKHPAGRYATAIDLAGDLSLIYDDIKLTEQELSGGSRLEKVKGLEFFDSFEESDILEVISASRWEDHAPGEEIIAEGGLGDAFYILVAGEVLVRRGATEVDVLGAGTSFGEIGFIGKGERTASIVARGHVTVMKVDAKLIERSSLDCQLRFHKAFLKTMAARLTRAMQVIGRASPV